MSSQKIQMRLSRASWLLLKGYSHTDKCIFYNVLSPSDGFSFQIKTENNQRISHDLYFASTTHSWDQFFTHEYLQCVI